MAEFFVFGYTFAAPIVSDTIKEFIEADNPDTALMMFVFKHIDCLYSAAVFRDANAFEKGERALGKWLSTKAKNGTGVID